MEDSVQRLMKAEKEVNAKVTAAQQKKTAKLKSIKEESAKDLAEFKALQEQKFQKDLKAKQDELAREDEAKGGSKGNEEMYAQLDADFNANKDAVIEMLIKNVMSVNIEIPKVVRGDFEEAEDKQ